MDQYEHSELKRFLVVWGMTLVWFIWSALALFFTIALAPSAWMMVPICAMAGGLIAEGFAIYNACAHTYAERYKNNGVPSSYRGQMRVLKKQIREARRQLWAFKDHPLSRDKYYAEMVQAERKLASLMEVDYAEPAQKPSSRW